MKLKASRESLLKPLQAVIGVVERRQTMPILANVMLVAKDDVLELTATDLEVELVATGEVDQVEVPGDITVPGRKLLDIVRALPEESDVTLSLKGDRLQVQSGRSRFVLSTLPASEFPVVEDIDSQFSIRLAQDALGRLLERTHFSMAQQDVRYYLNGLMFETGGARVRAVATDGHRLALCDLQLEGQDLPANQVIVPRKGVLELQRLLGGSGDVELAVGTNHIRAELDGIRFTSKLVDGRFPDYQRVIPEPDDNVLKAERALLRHAVQRAAILSNEKYRGIRLDALGAVESDDVEIGFVDSNSSCLIRDPETEQARYVVMPMRL